ncbi:transposase [Pseudomonas oryzihabitans]|nr:transposase [Pseudomonas psychrotolerans]
MTEKILALTDALGNLVKFIQMPGQRHDLSGGKALIADVRFDALLVDKAVDANGLIEERNRRGAQAVISQWPRWRLPLKVDRKVYRWRHLIEDFFVKLGAFNRIAMCRDKTDASASAVTLLATAVIHPRGLNKP